MYTFQQHKKAKINPFDALNCSGTWGYKNLKIHNPFPMVKCPGNARAPQFSLLLEGGADTE